jgi:hypothetical protein
MEPPMPEEQSPFRTHAMTHVGESPGMAMLQISPCLQSASLAHGPEVCEAGFLHEKAVSRAVLSVRAQKRV